MTQPELWPAIKAIVVAALDRAEAERSAYVAEACGSNVDLRREVETLLRAHTEAEPFLETPARLQGSAAPVDLMGRAIGSYTIGPRLGSGGMSDVYLARDTKLDRAVAVKLLSHELALNPERLQRFHAEARAASSINHPHILVVHDFGNLDGRPFIVTEFVEGETVRQRLSRGPMPPVDAIDVALQVGAALSAAHARGLVHRDIKPENVMRRPDGYVKVLDFGLAKLTAQVTGDAEFATIPGLVMGTPRYMSPEQVRGQELDARSDIWSLGVLLYEMVGGRQPFAGATIADTIAAILGTEPVPLALHLSTPCPTLERAVARALKKDRRDRYARCRRVDQRLVVGEARGRQFSRCNRKWRQSAGRSSVDAPSDGGQAHPLDRSAIPAAAAGS